ncbi:MAG: hypothetical protein IK137_00965 [Bacilli bacterium]|nr:hypothetical protein [Bacilli bacterium]
MLIGIIKNETTNSNYYIHIDKQDNYNRVSIIETTKNYIRSLSEIEAISILRKILSSKLTYKEKYNDYDVYLDEANNKRYFKDGKENYFMFLENNGVSALKYSNKKNKLNLHAKAYKIITMGIGFTIIFSSTALIPFADDTKFFKGTEYLLSSVVELTPLEATNLIKNSLYLSKEEKNHLANKDYFEFVLSHTDSADREYYLRNALNNLQIKHYNPEHLPGTNGYYNPLDINAINVCNTIEKNTPYYIDTYTHEFIHLTQTQSDYLYIMEATAEMLEYEFYNQPCDGYPELIRRTKVLMEIIGPEPVISCIFSGDTKHFENTIRMYLDDNDANRLLELFKTSASNLYETPEAMQTINKEIDELLAKMYYNKTGNDINTDLMMRCIFINNTDKRMYFNTKLDEYNNDYYLMNKRVEIDELDINDVVNSDTVSNYIYSTLTIEIVDGEERNCYGTDTTTDFSKIVPTKDRIVNIEFKDGTRGHTVFDIKTNSWEPVKHYKIVEVYEPSIPKKFPYQTKGQINDKTMPEKEVKSI